MKCNGKGRKEEDFRRGGHILNMNIIPSPWKFLHGIWFFLCPPPDHMGAGICDTKIWIFIKLFILSNLIWPMASKIFNLFLKSKLNMLHVACSLFFRYSFSRGGRTVFQGWGRPLNFLGGGLPPTFSRLWQYFIVH